MKHIQFRLSICIMILMLSCKDNVKSEMDTSQSEGTVEISNEIDKIEPPHWWTGFKNRQLQLLVKTR
jgi:hypothetical protein